MNKQTWTEQRFTLQTASFQGRGLIIQMANGLIIMFMVAAILNQSADGIGQNKKQDRKY